MANFNKNKKGNKNVGPLSNPYLTERHFIKTIRDIAYGNINMQSVAHYFTNQDYINDGMKATYEKMMKLSVHINAVNACMKAGTLMDNPYTAEVYNADLKSYEAWAFVYDILNRIRITGDTGFLLALGNKLYQYRSNS